jgi:inositol transporter-like SP family MFS transporter
MARSSPLFAAVAIGMASYVDAAAITGFGVALAIVQPLLGLDGGQIGLAAASLTVGIAVGAVGGGVLGDRIGRRRVFLTTMVVIAAAALALMLPPPQPTLTVAAVLLGLAVGADLPVSLAAVAELAPERRRGALLLVSNLLWVAGIVANFLIAAAVGDLGAVGIRVIFGHIALAAVLVLLGRLLIPESARWIAAERERAAGIQTVRATRTRVRYLVRGSYARPFLALIAFYALTNLVANTNGQFGVYILVAFGGATVSQASLIALLGVPVVVVGLLVFMRTIDGPARFRLFITGGCFGILAPLNIAVFGLSPTSYAVSTVLAAVGIVFAFEGMMKVWTQEHFPALLRSTAQGAVIGTARLIAAAFAAFTPLLLDRGVTQFYLLLTVFEVVGIGVAVLAFRRRPYGTAFREEAELDASA